MSQGYALHLVPRDPAYRPSPDQVTELMKFLEEQLHIVGELAVDGEDELFMKDAVERLRSAATSGRGGTECSASFDDLICGEVFGYDSESDEPDENFWADGIRIHLNAAPFPYGDWEYEDAHCPACGARITQIADLLEELRVSGDPLLCGCGAKTPPAELKMTSGVRLAQVSIAFTGNRDWYHEVEEDRAAFKDDNFLPALQDVLGTKVEVLAIST